MTVAIQAVPTWNGYVPEWLEDSGAVWLSRGAGIYRAERLGARPNAVTAVPLTNCERLAVKWRLARRALRLSCYNLIPLKGGALFASFERAIWRFADGRWHQVDGLRRPFRILRSGCAVTPDGDIFFGEYINNADRRQPVSVYKLILGSNRADIVFTFEPGEILHVHGIHWDPYDRALVLCAGDLPSECRILRTADEFATFDVVGAGDESWRTIQPLFTRDSIYYATDSEYADNHIYRVPRAANASRSVVAEVDGPSYYSAQLATRMIFATTAELCPSQRHREAVLWAVSSTGKAEPINSYKKDLFAARLLVYYFQAGIIQFPANAFNRSVIPFTGSGLTGLDGQMFALIDGDQA